jgi:hypothetical protein
MQQPDIQFCNWAFWHCPPTLGLVAVLLRKLIDFDESEATFKKCNCMGGWTVKVLHIQNNGHYNHGTMVTLIIAIKPGDPALPPHVQGSLTQLQYWSKCLYAIGTTTNIFRNFCDYICQDILRNLATADGKFLNLFDRNQLLLGSC